LVDSLGPNIYALTVPKNKLVGQLPASMANLKYLQFLYLSGNHLHGTVPDFFGAISTSLMQLGRE
jgi:hypothetical protein